jgi:hypothetical protein
VIACNIIGKIKLLWAWQKSQEIKRVRASGRQIETAVLSFYYGMMKLFA